MSVKNAYGRCVSKLRSCVGRCVGRCVGGGGRGVGIGHGVGRCVGSCVGIGSCVGHGIGGGCERGSCAQAATLVQTIHTNIVGRNHFVGHLKNILLLLKNLLDQKGH